MLESLDAHGRYDLTCIAPDGRLKWTDIIDNVVVSVGKDAALDAYLAGLEYTVTGPYMGLISSVGFVTVAPTDTMLVHAWNEAGVTHAPTYSIPRKTCLWNAAAGGAKSLAAVLSYTMTGSGQVMGAFMCFGSGALNTIDGTTGILYSAGTFAGGVKTVGPADMINVMYTATL